MRKIPLLFICLLLSAKRGEFLNSTGMDGKFHLDKRMYLCLNFSFNPGDDVREESSLKGELLFNGMEGHVDLDKAPECTAVTQAMIDRVNRILLAVGPPMKPGESRTVKLK